MMSRLSYLRCICAGLLLVPLLAWGQLLERVDVSRVANGAEIRIGFNTTVQYIRHAPLYEGKFLRIYLRFSDQDLPAGDFAQETLRSPKNDLVPNFAITYPDTQNSLLVAFAKSTSFTVMQGEDGRSIRILLPLPDAKGGARELPKPVVVEAPRPETVLRSTDAGEAKIAPSTPDAPEKQGLAAALEPEQLEAQASGLMDESRAAYAAKDYPKAINRLYRILGLPRNAQTEPAQALIGQVRDSAGEYRKARGEYELYLKLFPKGKEAAAIAERLTKLPVQDAIKPAARQARTSDQPAEWQIHGSLSSYYYGGRSSTDGETAKTDQSSMITSVNLNARLRDGATDTRFVFRESSNRNYLSSTRNYDRIYAAYGERTDRAAGYFVRAGRQNPNGSGVMERFDGLTGNYHLNDDWRIGAVFGNAVEFNTPYKKKFYGGNIEWLAQTGRPGINGYFIEQDVDGYLSRRAIGAEVRYFDSGLSGYGMVDYDLLYGALNMTLLQGNYLDGFGNNYYLTADRRRSPSLGLLNGLMLLGQQNLGDMVQMVGVGEARNIIEKGTPTSEMYSLGVTHQFNENWQLGLDYRLSFISAANAVIPLSQLCDSGSINEANGTCLASNGTTVFLSSMCTFWDPANNTCIASQQASGKTHSYTFQAIGSNLWVNNGVGVVNLSLTQGPSYTGQSLALNYIFPFMERWRLEGNLRYYEQRNDNGEVQKRSSPSVKIAYQWLGNLFVESEIGLDSSRIHSDIASSTTRRSYLYMGVRWDFR